VQKTTMPEPRRSGTANAEKLAAFIVVELENDPEAMRLVRRAIALMAKRSRQARRSD
jgi:hypothetical protein